MSTLLLRCSLAVSGLALALTASAPAGAVYQCGPDKDDCQCGMNDPYPCCDNGGNCTWWAWEQACCHWAVGLPGWGNANQWAGNAKAHPSYQVLSYPVVGSIATRVSGSYGHVAWVTKVDGSSVTVTEQNCWGGWGHQTATRDKSYYDGGYIVPNDQCECQPGQTQTESCGNCGERQRSCGASCQWGSWGACGGEGACTPGQSEAGACGECGSQSRTCQDDCSWSGYGACAPDPSFTGAACDTGKLGACADGAEQCVDGTIQCVASAEPAVETCNGLDDDCDGDTDEGACWGELGPDAGTPSKPLPGKGSTTPDATADNGDIEAGCACVLGRRASSDGIAALLVLLGFAGVARRRRA